MNLSSQISRRSALGMGVRFATAALMTQHAFPALAAADDRRFRIGACDWSLGKTADPDIFSLAREIGLDGIQLSLGTLKNDMRLRQSEFQNQCRKAAREQGVAIGSLAIGELNSVPYKSDPRTVEWVEDSVTAARNLGVKVVLLAFFSKNDLVNDPAGTDEVVRRLKAVAPKAEKAGVVLGIESWLSAEEHVSILDRVGSRAVQVYYDVRNSTDRGYDIFKEIRMLGAGRICEVHAKENGALLGRGKVDFEKVRAALDQIGYRGWIQIEGAVPPGGDLVESYKANCRFLRGIFNS